MSTAQPQVRRRRSRAGQPAAPTGQAAAAARRPSPAGQPRRAGAGAPGDPAPASEVAGVPVPRPAEQELPGDAPGTGPEPGRRRPSGQGPVVAVTGAARGLGHALAARLAESASIRRVVAIDDHRGDVTGVTWRLADVRDPALAGRLTGVDVLVHTDLDLSAYTDYRARRAFNVRAAQTVLTAAAAGRVGRVILVTSAMVYGARPGNPVPLPETAPLGADPDGSVAGDLLEIEHLARRARRTHPGMAVTVARPAALVGEGVDTLVTRHFEAHRLLAVKGSASRWQFCHTDDLISALELAIAGRVTGTFAIGCDGWLEQERVEELSGLRRVDLPAGLTFATAQRLHRIGITPAPVNDLQYLVYPWVVDCATLRQAGWRPAYDNEAALQVLLELRASHRAGQRRITGKEATITAAGATVAVIGTAAIVRAARRRKRGSP